MPTALLNDVELYYETEGNGEPVCWCRPLGGRALPGKLASCRLCRSVIGRLFLIAAAPDEAANRQTAIA